MAVEVDVERARRLFTIEEYVRMWEIGIFSDDERIELIDGEVVQMSPIGKRHFAFGVNLTHLLVHAVGDSARVSPAGPVRIPPRSMPQPDFALLRPRSYTSDPLTVDDVFVLIEVSDTSLRYDQTVKLRLYAHAGIPEYWIIDVKTETVTIYAAPTGDGYAEQRRVSRGERIAPRALPDAAIDVAAIFV